jgi:carbon-monoxide dehydrogenase medium subunit
MNAFAEYVAAGLHPESDLHASAEYRRELAAVLAERALSVAAARSGEGH